MLRRTLTFLTAIAIVAGVASLVYFNSQPVTLQFAPHRSLTLPLAWLVLACLATGVASVMAFLLAREGRWALRRWRLVRLLRAAERTNARRSEARASILAGRYTKARTLLAKTAKGAGANIDDAVDYGEAFLAEGRAADARAHFEEVRLELGDDARLLYALARSCRAQGDATSAVAALERAVEAMPASLALSALLRDCLCDLGWWQRAEVAQQRVVDLAPEDGAERRRLIDIRMRVADETDGGDREAALRSVLAMDPSCPAAAAGRASLLSAQGKTFAARRVLYRAAKRRPAEATLTALDALLENTDAKRLLGLYAKLRKRHPRDHELALHYAALLVRLGRDGEAERALAELEGSTGREGAAVESLKAEMLEKRSDLAGAVDALRRALDRSLEH